jgi:hypothetical protein
MPTLSVTARNAAVTAIAGLLNSGKLNFQTSAHNLVASPTFGATAFGTAANGAAAANTIADDTNAAGGTIDHCHLMKSDNTTEVMQCSCTVNGGGGDIELTSLVLGAGDTLSITSLSLSQPAS